LAVGSQPGARCDGKPAALCGSAVRWLVSVDEAKSRLALVRRHVEPDAPTISQLWVLAGAHELADVRVGLAFHQEFGDTLLKRGKFGRCQGIVCGGDQPRHVVTYAVGERDGTSAWALIASGDVDT
jgi:hypothetical protein